MLAIKMIYNEATIDHLNLIEPSPSFFISRGVITISGNGDFSADNGVINPGSAGTESDPFYIEKL